jgi:hypothetical protein
MSVGLGVYAGACACRLLAGCGNGKAAGTGQLFLAFKVFCNAVCHVLVVMASACLSVGALPHIINASAFPLSPLQVVAMHKQEAEANMFKAVVAVAEASVTPARQQQPITGLVMRGLVGATDRVLAEALSSLKHLRCAAAAAAATGHVGLRGCC